MRIAGDDALVEADPAAGRDAPVFTNMVSHWWDASEVYGTDDKLIQTLREGPEASSGRRLSAARHQQL